MATAADIARIDASISALETTVAALQTETAAKLGAGEADAFYLTIMGILVFFMQAGFALLEAGSVRSKNTKNILMKNLMDACLGAIIWWSWGHGVAVSLSLPRFQSSCARSETRSP